MNKSKVVVVIFLIALVAVLVGFLDDKKPIVRRLGVGGGTGVCRHGNDMCLTGHTCQPGGVLPPYIEWISWSEGLGQCGGLEIWFDGGEYTVVACHCSGD